MRKARFVFLVGLLLFALLASYSQAQDLYDLLRIDRAATEDQLAKAFKKLCLEFHPDKNPGNEQWAQDRFIEVAKGKKRSSDSETIRTNSGHSIHVLYTL